jgi:hypothetical protein
MKKNFLRDTKIFPASNFCENFPGSGAAGHFPALDMALFGQYTVTPKFRLKILVP